MKGMPARLGFKQGSWGLVEPKGPALQSVPHTHEKWGMCGNNVGTNATETQFLTMKPALERP